jgi:actin-related protein 10
MEGFKQLGLEEEAIVIEIGRLYTKCGIGKESLPRYLVRNPDKLVELDYTSTTEQYFDVLRGFLNTIYFHKVQANPKNSITIISEPLMAPKAKIQAIAKVLFEDLQVPVVCFVLEESLSLYTTGLYTGIIVDAGYDSIRILPVRVYLDI